MRAPRSDPSSVRHAFDPSRLRGLPARDRGGAVFWPVSWPGRPIDPSAGPSGKPPAPWLSRMARSGAGALRHPPVARLHGPRRSSLCAAPSWLRARVRGPSCPRRPVSTVRQASRLVLLVSEQGLPSQGRRVHRDVDHDANAPARDVAHDAMTRARDVIHDSGMPDARMPRATANTPAIALSARHAPQPCRSFS